MKVVISGQFGSYNLGDEAILYSIEQNFKNVYGENVSCIAVSGNPQLIHDQMSINSIKHPSLSKKIFTELFDLVKIIKLSNTVVIGGGSLLHDAIGLFKPIPRFLLPALIGILFGKRIIFYALGVGPICTKYSEYLIKIIQIFLIENK